MQSAMLTLGYIPDYFLIDDDYDPAIEVELPETATTVTRLVDDSRPFGRACSTYHPKVPVTLPRVTLIDGPYRAPPANDNKEATNELAA